MGMMYLERGFTWKDEKVIDIIYRKWNGEAGMAGHKCFIYFRVTLMPFLAPDLQKLAISEFPNFDESENYWVTPPTLAAGPYPT